MSNRFEPKADATEKQEAHETHEAPRGVEQSPAELIEKSQQEVAQFKAGVEKDLAEDESRAEKEGLEIDPADKKELQDLGKKAEIAQEELKAEVGEKQQGNASENIKNKTICPNCGREGKENAKFCEDCGKKVESLQVRVCLGCGKENKMGSKFCEDCGNKLEKAEQEKDVKPEVENANVIEIVKDKNFEGSIIIKTQDTEGRIVGYALRKNSSGDLEGNKIGYMKDGSTGWTQQLHESDFDELRKVGILEKYESSLSHEHDIEFAREEIRKTDELEDLEKRAGDFLQELGQNPSIEMAEAYENEYAIPAFKQVKELKNLIEANNSERHRGPEKEKPFNVISSIIRDKDALCIHFLTGFSNANNKTGTSGIESSGGDTFSKRSKEALKQLNTLAGLAPSISTSVFADTHNFEGTWYRDSGQPVGVILREGECSEISLKDADSKSASPKHRRGSGEVPTVDGIDKLLSNEERTYAQSGYNEFIVAEPKIGALFLTTDNPIEKECLKKLLQENEQFGYPLLFESNGKFYQIPLADLEGLLNEGDWNTVNVDDYLTNSREVSREDIRKLILTMENGDLVSNEKERFDQYVENYELKPHFEWAAELETAIATKNAYALNKEIKKNVSRENVLVEELETEGGLTDRLAAYFSNNSHLGKHWVEEKTRYYINGESYRQSDLSDEQLDVAEERLEKTEYWEYEESTVDESADNMVGIGESSNFQTKTKRYFRMIKFPNGNTFQTCHEKISVQKKVTDREGNEKTSIAYAHDVGEEMETSNNERLRTKAENNINLRDALRPLRFSANYGDNSLIIDPEDLEAQLSLATEMNDEKKKKFAAHAFAMAEMCEKDENVAEAEKWKGVAAKISGSPERYAFINSKLNSDGTLKLDQEDVANL